MDNYNNIDSKYIPNTYIVPKQDESLWWECLCFTPRMIKKDCSNNCIPQDIVIDCCKCTFCCQNPLGLKCFDLLCGNKDSPCHCCPEYLFLMCFMCSYRNGSHP